MSRKLTYVEIDLDFCGNTYGVYPCTASIPTTGERKCYNTLRTCQDIGNFVPETTTMRFAVPSSYLPKDIECIPNIVDISFIPGIVSLGEGLGQRATLTVTFKDHPHSDAGFNKDPYLSERGWDAFKRGTFWGKFRARYPYVQGRNLRVYRGELGQTLAEMEVRHYVMESCDGPTASGAFTIVAKDILKLVDNSRALAPAPSSGYLLSPITAADTGCRLTPSGVGSEYPEIGWANLGGNEIVRFIKMETTQNADCLLALHFNGTNGSTTFIDSSSFGRTVSPNNNAQLSTTNPRLGNACLLLDGADDSIQVTTAVSDFAFGTGDFTIAYWFNYTAVTLTHTHYDGRAVTSGTANALRIIRNSANSKIEVYINGVVIVDSDTTFDLTDANTWNNVVVMRKTGVLYLYVNGNLEDSAANATSIANGANRPIIGASGVTITIEEMQGRLDEFVVFDRAIFDPNEYDTPLGVEFPDITNRDFFALKRGQRGTEAGVKENDDRFQLCLEYSGQTPADIIRDLLVTYGMVPSLYVPLSAWQTEVNTYLQRNFGALIADPTGVAKLVGELLEQSGCALWWDDLAQQIRLRVLRRIAPEDQALNEDFFIEDSIEVTEQFDKRVSQVWTYYGTINPTENADQANNYRSLSVTVDLQEESNFGSPAIKKVFGRWIPQFARSTALRLNDLVLGRFKFPPRKFRFSTFGDASRDVVKLGGGYNAQFRTMQDDTGLKETTPVIVTHLNPKQDVFICEAQEALFAPFDADALNNRVIVIDTDTLNFNLREVHDSIFPVITDPYGITLTCIIEEGVIVGAEWEDGPENSGRQGPGVNGIRSKRNDSAPAFDVGSWPVGLDITIIHRGRIQGCGGVGGDSIDLGFLTAGKPGQDGGTGFYTRYPVTIECADTGPKINGGGGGGSGKANPSMGTGGGGAGREAGPGGTFFNSSTPDPAKKGNPGSLEVGGVGKAAAGAGGAPGVDGVSASSFGGDGGYAIDGISYVTFSNATPTIAGAQVN